MEPSDEFARLIARQIVEGSVTKSVLEQIRPVIPKALDELIRDRIQDKLNIAFRPDVAATQDASAKGVEADGSDVITTDEEMQAFYMVRAIGARVMPVERIVMRDAKSYCSVIVDDNNRKPVCRLYFNSKSKKSIGIFDSEKQETNFPLNNLNQLFDYSEKIEKALKSYLK